MGEEKRILEEALKLDPSSKIYLSLARLYIEDKEYDKAQEVLEHGLEFYPDSLDTILSLISIYSELNKGDKAIELVNAVFSRLKKNTIFWRLLAENIEEKGFVIPLKLLMLACKGEFISWDNIIFKGLESILGKNVSEDIHYEEIVEHLDFDQQVITPSLGEVLISQGEYEKALDVYEKLKERSESLEEKNKWQDKISEVNALIRNNEKQKEVEEVSTEEQINTKEEVEAREESQGAEEEVVEDNSEDMVDFLEELASSLEKRAE
ncbi:Tetratricopeptide repeat-containing protein [Desulfonauticus submarinus]|uniref:Tetratricopeptide repeat-containing protein n=1 Tax=Desulfonauticus submarinus TaxID=206665 RepID=A0A1H0BS13_9BACT|nr:tetratricopeptide repeat protein [Desulfonauticus submarinus]SDN48343.1 Tetratricopeptide repeat-containing protein [Desulfonauticus submarinus]